MRKCAICGQEKEDEFFIHDKYAKEGIRNVCRACNKKRAKIRRVRSQKHLEELEKENKQLKQDLRSIKNQLEIYFRNKSLRPVTKSEMLLDAFYQLLKNQYQD